MRIRGKVWVVTGGGSGMGRELALQLLSKGASGVAILDVSISGMQGTVDLAAHSSKLTTHVVDVSKQDQVEAAVVAMQQAHGGVIDGVINNAGIIQPFLEIKELEMSHITDVMNVNFYGTLYVTRALLPILMERSEAHIINISSMAGFVPIPGQAIYGASKAAIKLMTEALHSELSDTNVRVTVVHPGSVDTNIVQNSKVTLNDLAASSSSSNKFRSLPADKAAEQILQGVQRDYYRITVGKDATFLDLYTRLRPKAAAKLVYKNMKNLLGKKE